MLDHAAHRLLEHLAHVAGAARSLQWVKCDIDIPGCLMLELDASLAGPGEMYHTFPAAFDDGEHKWILLRFAPLGAFEDTNIVARYDGLTVGGFRSRDITEATGCYSRSGSIGAG